MGLLPDDEPYATQVGSIPPCPRENLKAETEYVHANLPGLRQQVHQFGT